MALAALAQQFLHLVIGGTLVTGGVFLNDESENNNGFFIHSPLMDYFDDVRVLPHDWLEELIAKRNVPVYTLSGHKEASSDYYPQQTFFMPTFDYFTHNALPENRYLQPFFDTLGYASIQKTLERKPISIPLAISEYQTINHFLHMHEAIQVCHDPDYRVCIAYIPVFTPVVEAQQESSASFIPLKQPMGFAVPWHQWFPAALDITTLPLSHTVQEYYRHHEVDIARMGEQLVRAYDKPKTLFDECTITIQDCTTINPIDPAMSEVLARETIRASRMREAQKDAELIERMITYEQLRQHERMSVERREQYDLQAQRGNTGNHTIEHYFSQYCLYNSEILYQELLKAPGFEEYFLDLVHNVAAHPEEYQTVDGFGYGTFAPFIAHKAALIQQERQDRQKLLYEARLELIQKATEKSLVNERDTLRTQQQTYARSRFCMSYPTSVRNRCAKRAHALAQTLDHPTYKYHTYTLAPTIYALFSQTPCFFSTEEIWYGNELQHTLYQELLSMLKKMTLLPSNAQLASVLTEYIDSAAAYIYEGMFTQALRMTDLCWDMLTQLNDSIIGNVTLYAVSIDQDLLAHMRLLCMQAITLHTEHQKDHTHTRVLSWYETPATQIRHKGNRAHALLASIALKTISVQEDTLTITISSPEELTAVLIMQEAARMVQHLLRAKAIVPKVRSQKIQKSTLVSSPSWFAQTKHTTLTYSLNDMHAHKRYYPGVFKRIKMRIAQFLEQRRWCTFHNAGPPIGNNENYENKLIKYMHIYQACKRDSAAKRLKLTHAEQLRYARRAVSIKESLQEAHLYTITADYSLNTQDFLHRQGLLDLFREQWYGTAAQEVLHQECQDIAEYAAHIERYASWGHFANIVLDFAAAAVGTNKDNLIDKAIEYADACWDLLKRFDTHTIRILDDPGIKQACRMTQGMALGGVQSVCHGVDFLYDACSHPLHTVMMLDDGTRRLVGAAEYALMQTLTSLKECVWDDNPQKINAFTRDALESIDRILSQDPYTLGHTIGYMSGQMYALKAAQKILELSSNIINKKLDNFVDRMLFDSYLPRGYQPSDIIIMDLIENTYQAVGQSVQGAEFFLPTLPEEIPIGRFLMSNSEKELLPIIQSALRIDNSTVSLENSCKEVPSFAQKQLSIVSDIPIVEKDTFFKPAVTSTPISSVSAISDHWMCKETIESAYLLQLAGAPVHTMISYFDQLDSDYMFIKNYIQSLGIFLPEISHTLTLNLSHIYAPEIRVGRKGVKSISGFHHDYKSELENRDLLKIINPRSNDFGVIAAEIKMNGISKEYNTFFPPQWDRIKVIQKTIESLKNCIDKKIKKDRIIYQGKTKEGINIETVIEEKTGLIITSYPIM